MLEVGWSGIVSGQQGLFAKEDIGSGIHLGTVRVQSCRSIYRVDCGGFGNHSWSPNCKTVDSSFMFDCDGVSCVFEHIVSKTFLVSLRPIVAGEEVTWSYSLPEYDGADFIKNRGLV